MARELGQEVSMKEIKAAIREEFEARWGASEGHIS
jgi:hypothetical protein